MKRLSDAVLLLLSSMLLIMGGAIPTARAGEIDRVPLAIRVETPEDGLHREGTTSLIEVRGWAGAYSIEQTGLLDIAVIVDTSWSARRGSGADVNGDGHAGGHGFGYRRSFFGWLTGLGASSDPDDSILRAEIAAVRGLDESLEDERNRIAIVMMRGFAGIGTRIGDPPERMERTLGSLERARPEGRTNFMEAIRLANQVLVEAPDDGIERSRVIILLSDGYPTVPPGDEYATDQAIVAAHESAALDIRIFAVGLGLGSGDESRAFRESARVTGGRFLALDKPGDVIRALAEIKLTGLDEVTIENLTTGKPASMQRLFPDGTFDGFVKLKQGKNRLRIEATSVEGDRVSEERVVIFKHKWPHDRRARWKAKRQVEEMQSKLLDRQAEEALIEEMRKTRERLARELDVTVE